MCEAFCMGGAFKCARALVLGDAASPGRYDKLKSDLMSPTPQEDAISAVAEREEFCEGSLLSGRTDKDSPGAFIKLLSPDELDAIP